MFCALKLTEEQYERLTQQMENFIFQEPTTCPKLWLYPEGEFNKIDGGKGYAFQFMLGAENILIPNNLIFLDKSYC